MVDRRFPNPPQLDQNIMLVIKPTIPTINRTIPTVCRLIPEVEAVTAHLRIAPAAMSKILTDIPMTIPPVGRVPDRPVPSCTKGIPKASWSKHFSKQSFVNCCIYGWLPFGIVGERLKARGLSGSRRDDAHRNGGHRLQVCVYNFWLVLRPANRANQA